MPVPQSTDPSHLLKHTLLHHTLKRLLVTNNGQPFGANDWSRLKRIAEGNPDETKIGAFGVGFYSVFADCEEPFVSSGREAMAFYWKGNSLFTRRLQLPEASSSPDTSFVLDFRNTTSSVPGLLPLSQFLASSLTFVANLRTIELWLDDWKLLELNKVAAPGNDVKIPKNIQTKTGEGLMTITGVVRETAQINAQWMNIVGWKPKMPQSNGFAVNQASTKSAHSNQSLRSFFSRLTAGPSNAVAEKGTREERENQEAISEDLIGESKATVFLHVNTASIRTSVNSAFSQELERATKKPPPKSTNISLLTSSYDETSASSALASGIASKETDIFASVLPSNSGRIFIGFPTHQTTGLNAHVSAPSVIPTVERESIDLNARWVRTWNMELLRAAGTVCRIAWSGEMDAVQANLSRVMLRNNKTKPGAGEIQAVLPEAVHVCNQFTFRESTPSSQVGSLVEEAFWTCNKKAPIDILSSCGILPSQKVRLASEDLSFVEGIPTLPGTFVAQASGFIKRLTDYGIITDITVSDIRDELGSKTLTTQQLSDFLGWVCNKLKRHEIDGVVTRSLFDVAVANDNEEGPTHSSGRILVLADMKYFIKPSRIPSDVPVPPNTMPFKYTKNLEAGQLEGLGWEDLQIVPWIRWLIENVGGQGPLSSEQDLTQSPSFASKILPVISKQWDGLSQSSKATLANLMSSRTVIPTKMGMKRPSEAYFPSVKLFDDLPVVMGLHSVKEKVLVAFGVRKTIELGIIFDRLIGTSINSNSDSVPEARWNHIDLIKYLTSVRNDIPKDDIQRLKNTPTCPSEASNAAKGNSERFVIAKLFEPIEALRALGLPLLQWPGVYRRESEEGRFLTSLGLRAYPTVPELIEIAVAAYDAKNSSLRDRALRYYIDHHHTNGYSSFNMATVRASYLPLDNSDCVVTFDQCFTNERATILGNNILRRDLHSHAQKFAVKADPPISDCIDNLTRKPPVSKRDARDIFAYFAGRLAEINPTHREVLSQANIVPVPSRSSVKSSELSEKLESIRHLAPSVCFLGYGEKYADIFDYVDFGQEANLFLLGCGSKHEPSEAQLAQLVVREPARIFTVFQSPERYLDLLRSLATAWSTIKKDKGLVKEMKKARFLLATKEFPSRQSNVQSKHFSLLDAAEDYDDDVAGVKTYQLASASQIVVVDDVSSYNLFKSSLLAAPLEDALEDFYIALGASPLESLVEDSYRIGSPTTDQKTAAKVQTLIKERTRLFLHDLPNSAIKHDSRWLDKNLTVESVRSLVLRRSLKGHNLSHSAPRSAAVVEDYHKGWVLHFTSDKYDLYEVSQALLSLLLLRPKPGQAMMLETLLGTDLLKLRSRGYNVDRILRQKAAEARVAEESRKAQLQEEQQRIREQELAFRESQARGTSRAQEPITMPGFFPDSPEHKSLTSTGDSVAEDSRSSRPRGLFSEITRRLGIESGTRPTSQDVDPPPPYSQNDSQKASKQVTPPAAVTAPHRLQENLVNAIQASRSHNSNSVVSQPQVNEVKETQTYCDSKPAQNISFVADSSSGFKIYLSNDIADKNKFMAANSSALNEFGSILIECAAAFALSRTSVHIYYDEAGETIAFNANHAIFCNYRYFENLHLPAVQQQKKSDAVVYWFVVLCHELAHNLVADHSAAHSYYVYVLSPPFLDILMIRSLHVLTCPQRKLRDPIFPAHRRAHPGAVQSCVSSAAIGASYRSCHAKKPDFVPHRIISTLTFSAFVSLEKLVLHSVVVGYG